MADRKITDLTKVTASNISDSAVVPVFGTSASNVATVAEFQEKMTEKVKEELETVNSNLSDLNIFANVTDSSFLPDEYMKNIGDSINIIFPGANVTQHYFSGLVSLPLIGYVYKLNDTSFIYVLTWTGCSTQYVFRTGYDPAIATYAYSFEGKKLD